MNKRDRMRLTLRAGWRANADLLELWSRISRKAEFSLTLDSEALVAAAREAISKLPRLQKPKIVAKKADIELDEFGVRTTLRSIRSTKLGDLDVSLPDPIASLQERTGLTRATISAILAGSDRISDFLVDPQKFVEVTSTAIFDVVQRQMAENVRYQRSEGSLFELREFENREQEGYLTRMVKVRNSIHDYVCCDSDVEKNFATRIDVSENVRFFLKLPGWFQIDTPLGGYNPDWAIVKDSDTKLYLVRETKGDASEGALRGLEAGKIECARRYFQATGVDYDVITDAADL